MQKKKLCKKNQRFSMTKQSNHSMIKIIQWLNARDFSSDGFCFQIIQWLNARDFSSDGFCFQIIQWLNARDFSSDGFCFQIIQWLNYPETSVQYQITLNVFKSFFSLFFYIEKFLFIIILVLFCFKFELFFF